MEKKRKENLLETHKEIIEKYWDYEKNNELKLFPENFTKGSHQKVWWKCEECGKSWLTGISDKIYKNTKCPYCSNKKLLKGFNDFKTWCINNNREDLLKEWNFEENGNPDEYLKGSKKLVSWTKEFFKYNKIWKLEWKATISNRCLGTNCPYISVPMKKLLKGFNDFESWCIHNNRKDLLEEWDFEENGNPNEYFEKSNKIVSWTKTIDSKKLRWKSSIYQRINGKNCPYISKSNTKVYKGFNDFETLHPELLNEWNYKKTRNYHLLILKNHLNQCGGSVQYVIMNGKLL